MAKLVGKTSDGEATATKVVGTFGYLAPEYVMIFLLVSVHPSQNLQLLICFVTCVCRYLTDGLATAKSDVYAFGVVLFEIISGKEAIIRTEGMVSKNQERRSLASFVCSATA